MKDIRYNWTKEEIREIYHTPLLDLVYSASSIHRKYHHPAEIQVSSLISIKTGGCSEDCGYCSQSAHHDTDLKVQKILPLNEVEELSLKAREGGASRICLGAAWREVRNNRDFEKVLEMVNIINQQGLEVCCTLGMLTEEQAQKLAKAGLHSYNHNLDTSEEYYSEIIKTRSFQDRIRTLNNARKAGISLCSGGIIGMGESEEDRIGMLHTFSAFKPHPESFPINALVPVKGTPLEHQKPVPVWDMVRIIATARIVMPRSSVRLSAGRSSMSAEGQALCFLAGANSIFSGDKLLTTPNPGNNEDLELFRILGLRSRKAGKTVKEEA